MYAEWNTNTFSIVHRCGNWPNLQRFLYVTRIRGHLFGCAKNAHISIVCSNNISALLLRMPKADTTMDS